MSSLIVPGLTCETVFEVFAQRLKTQFHRDLSQYAFIHDRHDAIPPRYLEDYLLFAKHSFTKSGLALTEENSKPFRSIDDFKGDIRPFGIYFVHPDTEHEVIILLYRREDDSHAHTEGFVAYKNRDSLLQIIEGIKGYARMHEKRQQQVILFPEQERLPRPTISWDDIVLPEATKTDIRKNVEAFLAGKRFYDNMNIPYKRGFLFVGPPGNGKTMICKIIAAYTALSFIYFNKRRMENEHLDAAFEQAQELAPAAICFEDLDTLFDEHITMSHFLNTLDGFVPRNGLLILATTNHPEKIDPALKNRPSRFDRAWILDNPNSECRNRYLRRLLPSTLSDSFIATLAAHTKGFSMAHLKELYVSASLLALNRGLTSPAEMEFLEALRLLTAQFKSAKRDFESEEDAVLGFGRDRVPA
jgi:hypothetical protein